MTGSSISSGGEGDLAPVLWTAAEPGRLVRDRNEIGGFAPEAVYRDPVEDPDSRFRHGGWSGRLPRWPFERPEPDLLAQLIGPEGLPFELSYSAAHPMVPPTIYPLDPDPTFEERTQTAWHVAPGGSLCLLRSDGDWKPETSVVELLLKAAGWRFEYALMKAGVISAMSVSGIVSDSASDHLVAEAARILRSPSGDVS